jgi:hypothetical protein
MYRIIGGDGQEYGPVNASEVRQWIAEGRLNADSKIRPEESTEWTTLGSLPEFAGAARPAAPLGTPGPLPGAAPLGFAPLPGGSREEAMRRLTGPAIGLMVTGGLGIAAALLGIVMRLFGGSEVPPGLPPEFNRMFEMINGPVGYLSDFFSIVVFGLILFGAYKMKNLQSYGLAFGISILAMLPCQCCCILGLPFGIWALVVMTKPEVKSQFS